MVASAPGDGPVGDGGGQVFALDPTATALNGGSGEPAPPASDALLPGDGDIESAVNLVRLRLARASPEDARALRLALSQALGLAVGESPSSPPTPSEGVDELLGTVAHELRTPVGLIKEYAATLLAPDAPRDEETVRRCLFVVLEVSSELEELVERVRDLSKVSGGALSVAPRSMRLRPLVRTAIGRIRVRTAGHRLRLDVPAHLPRVLADPPRLRQVLGNLLENAIKYSPDGGQIRVSAEAAGGEVLVRVSDQGLGVSAEELGILFDRLYRGTAARARKIQGQGLGLAICKGIVEAHGGRIWAESPAPGRPAGAGPGTTILFTLPIAPGARPGTGGTELVAATDLA
ncbi:MAG TPA: ATP-binding protein [Chloroflexota bacterium]